MPSSGEFRLSITQALRDQLIASLDQLEPESLTAPALAALHDRGGIYQLFLGDALLYVGKADTSLPGRLGRHLRKLSGRANIDLVDVGFAALYVYEDLKAVAAETLLIDHYRALGQAPWNFNGFGNNDPGQNRDQTVFPSKHFDVLYPARLDLACDAISAGVYTAQQLSDDLKAALPYVFRFQSSADLAAVTIEVPQSAMTADELFALLATGMRSVDARWRVVALPGYVIMYPKVGDYPSAVRGY